MAKETSPQNYSKTKQGIRVSVEPMYLENQSSPSDNQYAWAYFVRMENLSSDEVQLISRHWKITDAFGISKEVRGPGVVGEQPVLKPGSWYEYNSGTLLPTNSGIMAGSYQMLDVNGKAFDVEIPAFSLDVPGRRVMMN